MTCGLINITANKAESLRTWNNWSRRLC